MSSATERRREDERVILTVLAVVGWVLPLAGLVWGPGSWWQYMIWLAGGTAAIWWYDRLHPDAKPDSE